MCLQPVGRKAANASASATSSPPRGEQARHGQQFPLERRIRRRADYQAVYHGGVRLGARCFVVFALATGADQPGRIGLTVTRKIGNAVVRNRCKRLLREAIRKHWSKLPEGVDVVLHARRALAGARTPDVEEEIGRVLPQAVRRIT